MIRRILREREHHAMNVDFHANVENSVALLDTGMSLNHVKTSSIFTIDGTESGQLSFSEKNKKSTYIICLTSFRDSENVGKDD